MIEPLTNPTAHGGAAQDAFHLVIPSLPGHGFSARPIAPGWGPDQIARAWDALMKRLGYTRYVAQGGDWGAVVTEAMGAALAGAGPVPEMSEQERTVFNALIAYRKSGYSGYFVALTTRPQAVGYGLTDSPAGLAAFFLWHPGFAQWKFGDDPADLETKDEVLDDITLYWLTNTAASSGRLYWENHGASPTSAATLKSAEISVPVGTTVFPTTSTGPRRAGPGAPIPTSSTSTRSTGAGTSPPGSSRSCSARRSGPRSGRSAGGPCPDVRAGFALRPAGRPGAGPRR